MPLGVVERLPPVACQRDTKADLCRGVSPGGIKRRAWESQLIAYFLFLQYLRGVDWG